MRKILFAGNSDIARTIKSALSNSYHIVEMNSGFDNFDTLKKNIEENNIEIFINSVEYSDLDKAEYFRGDAYFVNGFYLKNISKLCKENGVFLIQLSTSYVFDGLQQTPYLEEDKTNPATVYGDSKLLGEKFIQEHSDNFSIIRIPHFSNMGNFLILEGVRHLVNERDFNIISHQYIMPLFLSDIVQGVKNILDKERHGIIHIGRGRAVSAIDFYKTVFEEFKIQSEIDYNCNIIERDFREFGYTANRLVYDVLDCTRYVNEFNLNMENWDVMVKNFISDNIQGK